MNNIDHPQDKNMSLEELKQRQFEEQARIDKVLDQEDPYREMREAKDGFKAAMSEFLQEEAGMLKGLAQQGKKALAKEVLHLRAVVKTIRKVMDRPEAPTAEFMHAEAFKLMTYVQVNAEDGEELEVLRIWNSRDGITPFVVNIGTRKYEHNVAAMRGPYFDRPEQAGYEWVTRTDWQVLDAWNRTLNKAVELGRFDEARAEQVRSDLKTAESWHYRIGLRNMSTGEFTDAEVLKSMEAFPTAADLQKAFRATGQVTQDAAHDLAQLALDMFNGIIREETDEPTGEDNA